MSVQTTAFPSSQNITRAVLDNGITVLAYENFAAQSVVIAGSLAVGSMDEPALQNGLAYLTAASLMRGTENRDFHTINASLEDIGADLGLGAGIHKTRFFGKSLAEDLDTLLDVLSDVLRYPTFPPGQVERLRGEIITGLQIRQNDTRARAGRAFRQRLYAPEHPYHYAPRGTLETVPDISVDDLRHFHQQYYGPAGMLLTIVGGINAKEAVAAVSRSLGDWHNPDQPQTRELPLVTPPGGVHRVSTRLPGKTQSAIVLGVPGPSRYADDYLAAQLANSILGQFGMMGRIGNEVREKQGLAYYAYSRLDGGHGPGAWAVSAGVSPDDVERAIDSIVREIRRIATELVTDEDLHDNQSYFVGRLPLQLESNEGQAGIILSMESYGLGLDYLLEYRDRITSLTRADLLRAVQNYWNPDAFVLSIAGPAQPVAQP